MFLYLLLRSGKRAALCSLIPAVAAIVFVWVWLTGAHHPAGLLSLAAEPFQVARTGFTPLAGDQNLMYLVQTLFHLDSSASSQTVELAAALSILLPVSYLSFYVHRRRSVAWHLAILATLSYALIKHHSYDGVVLIFPLCYALRRWQVAGARVAMASLAYLFYGQRALEGAHLHPQWSFLVEFAMLMVILAAVYTLREQTEPAAMPLHFPTPAFEEVALAG